MTATTHARRRTIAALSTVGLAAPLIVVAGAPSATAAEFVVSTQAEYFAAVAAAEDNDQADTITLANDIVLDDESFPVYDSDEDLTLDGAGFSIIDGDGDRNYGGFMAHREGPIPGQITLRDVSFEDFGDTNWGAIWVDSSAVVTLDNVTVSNTGGRSAVFLLAPGGVDIVDSTFTDNAESDEDGGGAVYIDDDDEGATARIVGSTFTDNSTETESGGAIYAYVESLIIEDSTFTGNSAYDVGGAVYADAYELSVSGSTFNDNSSGDDGGAIYSWAYTTITTSSFDENEAGDDGGAVASVYDLKVELSTFTDNSAIEDGGAIHQAEYDEEFDVALEIDSSTFEGNTAGDDGGAAYVADGEGFVTNSLFSYNTAADDLLAGDVEADGNEGGALYASNEGYEVVNSTFFSNIADEAGGAISADSYLLSAYSVFDGNQSTLGAHVFLDTDGSALEVAGSVFDGAVGTVGCEFDSGGDAESYGYNFDEDGTCTGDHAGEGDLSPTDGDPLLGALADNGGPTRTLAPQEGSILIDAIPTATVEAVVPFSIYTVDARGIDRPEGDGADIGAVEIVIVVEEPEPEPTGGEVTFEVKTNAGTIYGTASPAIAVDGISWITPTSLASTPPAGIALPYGAAAFTVEVPTAGASVTITLTAPTPFTSIYKVTGTEWTEIAGATFSDDRVTVTYTLVDGGALDEDGEANGEIVDPVALAVEATFTG